MTDQAYKYVIAGGGLAGASAVEGIRQRDATGSVLIIGNEPSLPYHRPPLTKGLWSGKKKVEDIFVRNQDYYSTNKVDVKLGVSVSSVHPDARTVTDSAGTRYGFEKLLLATGGTPNRLKIPGGDCAGLFYYRYLEDYRKLTTLVKAGKSAIVIGGGFIGTEMAAALADKKVSVTMLFPESRPCFRIFPDYLGNHISKLFKNHGITMLTDDRPMEIEQGAGSYKIKTEKGKRLEADVVIAGIGISPSIGLAKEAGLAVAQGILVNSFLQTSHPDIYAAGDAAIFPDKSLGTTQRVEHWDNALNQGKHAGTNMAGAQKPYSYMSYFFSDLFEIGYEAVGDIDSRLETHADWKEENVKGVIYFIKEHRIRGVLLCNVWDKVDAARALVQSGALFTDNTHIRI
jgi:NADPH-dependent 2,4-dienoyl-CoA reductase/sulfur reductase-like enzyme